MPASPVNLHDRIRSLFEAASVEMNGRDVKHLEGVRGSLPAGARIAITWLPNETVEQRIAAAAAAVAAGLTPMPHIAARFMGSRGELDDTLQGLAAVGVRRVFAIAGDVGAAKGPFNEALDIVASGALEKAGIAEVGVSFYPEGHPQISAGALATAFAAKMAVTTKAGLKPFVMTQFCFSAAPILAMLDRIEAEAPGTEVRVGLAGPTNPVALMKFAMRCGVATSAKFATGKASAAARLLVNMGPEPIITELARDRRFAAENRALHFFAFGGLERTTRWMHAIASGNFALTHNRGGFRVTEPAKKK